MTKGRPVLAVVMALLLAGGPALACYSTTAAESRAKNLILFVVDGFGFGTQAVGRMVLAGPDNKLRLESLPYVGVMSHTGRTKLATDDRSALWEMIWGVRADAGEVPVQASGRSSWLAVAKLGGRAVGLIADGRLEGTDWPAGTLVRPAGPAGAGSDVLPAKLAAVAPEFLFGWTQNPAAWDKAAGLAAKPAVTVAHTWTKQAVPTPVPPPPAPPAPASTGTAPAGAPAPAASQAAAVPAAPLSRDWYLLPGAPANPLTGSVSPSLAEVTAQALAHLVKAPNGFILVVHVGGLGEALRSRDLGLAVANLGLLDEAVGQAMSFAEQTEATAMVVASTGDPTDLTLLDAFTPRRLDQVTRPLAEVARAVRGSSSAAMARETIRKGLGLQLTESEVIALRKSQPAQLERQLGERVAEAVGVHFGSGRPSVNPVPVLAYGPGSWVYGRMLDATEIPALTVGQLWLDPASLTPAAQTGTT